MKKTRKFNTFGLTELLIVIAIIALLAAIFLPAIAKADPVTRQGTSMPPMQLAQATPPAPSGGFSGSLTNIPQSSVSNATFLVSVGMVANNNATAAGTLENRLEIGYVLPVANNELFLFGAIQNAPTSGILDLEGAGFGFRKVLANNSEIYAKVGGEHSSASKAWDAALAVGISYSPGATGTSTILAGSLFCEEWAVHLFGGLTPDYLRTVVGYRFNF